MNTHDKAQELIYTLEHSGSETPEESRAKKKAIEAIKLLQLIAESGGKTVYDFLNPENNKQLDGHWAAEQAKQYLESL